MRIAYLVNQYPTVSHTFIRREIRALERRGIEVTRIAIRGWNSELVDDDDRLERGRTHYVLRGGAPALLISVLRTLFTRPQGFVRALAVMWSLGRRAERPLPIHLIYLAEACHIEALLRASAVRHLHAHFGTNSAEVAMLVHALGGPAWSFTVHGPEEFDKAQSIALAKKVRDCAFVVAISSFGRSQLYRCLEYQYWPKVKVVHCGLEARPDAMRQSPSVAEPRFVCVGRLCEQKGQLLLIEAARLLAARGTQFDLVLVGDGELRPHIETLVARYKLQSRIRITGWLSGEAVQKEIAAARALVLPSFAEGLPVVIMEAMALGRPVISTFVAGIPELVEAGKHGWLLPAGDVGALVAAMQECIDAPPATLARMGEAGRARVLARHNADTEAGELVKLFQAVSD